MDNLAFEDVRRSIQKDRNGQYEGTDLAAQQRDKAKRIGKICASITKKAAKFAADPRLLNMGDLTKVLSDLTEIDKFLR